MILILAPSGDTHARRVVQEIELLGHDAQVLDWRRAGTGLRASLGFAAGETELAIAADEDAPALHIADVRAVWNRRPGGAAEPASVIDPDYRRFAAREWQDLSDGLTSTLGLDACVVNPLSSQRAAVKPFQLAAAQRVGLRVPATLITSDPVRAAAFVQRHKGRVVHKAMTSPRTAFVDTRRWQERDRRHLEELPLAPTIFQELIDGPVDIRATIVGDELFAAAIHTRQSRSGIDSRLDLDVPATPYELPSDVRAALRALMDRLGLVFSTVDLKLDDAGRAHFLELNPQGQFLYIEVLTQQPIAPAVARLLVGHDCRGHPGASGRPRAPSCSDRAPRARASTSQP